ncbi:hypothetical protein HOF65_07455 [bacterium]|jgi:hypothetical protein|nr:hypothetical protein [bacterium]MBT3853750.1 hypothetical protein [bacterium]MBT4632950.1 hypothetical protein [bacterium]MBT5491248.1 hypothetical protein [bacterium]MBT6779181.1 hypothetical protein [bacterium]
MEKIKKHIVHENEKKYKKLLSLPKKRISKPVLSKNRKRLGLQNRKTLGMLVKNIDNTRTNMSDVIKLSEDFTSQIFVNSYKENTFSLNKVSISTFNDN